MEQGRILRKAETYLSTKMIGLLVDTNHVDSDLCLRLASWLAS